MSKKIVYFVHCYPPAFGGLEFLSGEIVKILREAGHDVQVITGRGQTLDSYKTFTNLVDTKNDAKYIHRLPLKKQWQRLANKLFNKLIFISGNFSPWYFGPILDYDQEIVEVIKNADIIFGAGMPTKMFYDAYRFARKYKKKLILHPSYHDVSYYNRSIFFQKALGFADNVIYQTPLEKNTLNKNYQLNEARLVQLTYCPYTKADWQKAHKRAKDKEIKLQNKIKNHLPITIGYVGQITLRKNLDFFADFIKENQQHFQEKGLKVNYLFAGAKTNSSSQVEELFNDYKDLVTFIYDFKDKDKKKIFNQIDIFINPSEEESLGLVNFEVLYHGLPTLIHKYSAFCSISFSKSRDSYLGRLINNGLEEMIIMTTDDYDLISEISKDDYILKLLYLIDKNIMVI